MGVGGKRCDNRQYPTISSSCLGCGKRFNPLKYTASGNNKTGKVDNPMTSEVIHLRAQVEEGDVTSILFEAKSDFSANSGGICP